MQLIDYIDFKRLFLKIKESHLESFPNKEDYKEYLQDIKEDYSFVDALYLALDRSVDDVSFPTSETSDDLLITGHVNNRLIDIELFIGGNNATEDGDNYWGYSFIFTADLDEELFVDYQEENHS